jgi:hypothetical protein
MAPVEILRARARMLAGSALISNRWSTAIGGRQRILGGCVTESERDRAHGFWKAREGARELLGGGSSFGSGVGQLLCWGIVVGGISIQSPAELRAARRS